MIEFETTVVFCPCSSTSGSKPSETRTVTFTTPKIPAEYQFLKKAKKEAISQNSIDKYALRRGYWQVAGGETRVQSDEWSNPTALVSKVGGYTQVKGAQHTTTPKRESIFVDVSPPSEVPTVEQKIHCEYGNKLPTIIHYARDEDTAGLEIKLRYVWPHERPYGEIPELL